MVGSSTYDSIGSFSRATGYEDDGVIGLPHFVNVAENNFSITINSDALDSGMDSDIYDRFQSLYGLSIRKDISGTNRPIMLGWDIGASEYVDGPTPSSPLNLHTVEN